MTSTPANPYKTYDAVGKCRRFSEHYKITGVLTRKDLIKAGAPCLRYKGDIELLWPWMESQFGNDWIFDQVSLEPCDFYYWFITDRDAALCMLKCDSAQAVKLQDLL